MSYPDPGTGTTIAFGTTAFAANVISLAVGAANRPVIRTTKLNATQPSTNQEGGHTSKPGLIHELGPIRVRIQWNPANGSRIPLHAAPETVTLTFPDSSTLSGSGYISSHGEIEANHENVLECDIEVQRTGIWS